LRLLGCGCLAAVLLTTWSSRTTEVVVDNLRVDRLVVQGVHECPLVVQVLVRKMRFGAGMRSETMGGVTHVRRSLVPVSVETSEAFFRH